MKSSKSLPIPWKWFSTEHVTAPPSFLHTIISWGHALPLGLCPLLPLVPRESVKGGGLPILVSPPFSHKPGNALESTAPRWLPHSTLLWQEQSGAATCQLKHVGAFTFWKANQCDCFCSWAILFAFRGCMLSLIGKMAFSQGKSHILGVHNDMQAEKRQGGGILGVFWSPWFQKVQHQHWLGSVFWSSLMIRNLLTHKYTSQLIPEGTSFIS